MAEGGEGAPVEAPAFKIEAPKAPLNTRSGFLAFLMRGNVVDLAVAVIIGAAFVSVVTAFVKDLLTPLIAAVGGKPNFGALAFTINHSRFLYGDFINAVLAFVIVAAVLYYFVILPMNAVIDRARRRREPADPTQMKCPECLSTIPIGARRCAYCTASVAPAADASAAGSRPGR